jgi:hypothetical protein
LKVCLNKISVFIKLKLIKNDKLNNLN